VSAATVAVFPVTICVLILLWLVVRYSFLVPASKGLPILMYHKVSRDHEDSLTIAAAHLDSQLAYLKVQGYQSVSFAELKSAWDYGHPLPPRPILLTFDDAYLRTYELASPVLSKHDFKATIFLPVAFIGKSNTWDDGTEPLMSYDLIRQLAGSRIEFGLHSYRHENYQRYTAAQMEADLFDCVRTLEANGCTFTRVFAYPYGRMPAGAAARKALYDSFRRHKIDFAVRIGSRINSLPPGDPYELKRTGIDGTDSFREFKIKVRKGRLKLF
jgi:peptidoglycan/xylan/chitin deacetylase (PgdA/CDA1 family)